MLGPPIPRDLRSRLVGQQEREVDVVVVGAGFAGLYMLQRARSQDLSVQVFEAGDGVGGTWYWNRYPGARCDVESMEYSYGFDEELQQEWEWTEKYAPQPEILSYANHVADRFDLRRDIQLSTRVTAATFDDESERWEVSTDQGDHVSARFVVMATGCLSAANIPDIPGAGSFEGPTYHTGQWPHEPVDFTGHRVAVIGTGSSAIQSIPIIAERALELTVFQRTPTFTVPAWNEPLDPVAVKEIKSDYAQFRAENRLMPTGFGARMQRADRTALEVTEAERRVEYERRWERGGLPFLGAFTDLLLDKEANDTAAEFVREKLHEIVRDPDTARKLTPDTVVGCKRLCVDTGYWATFNQPHVHLVDLRETPIEAITPDGIQTTVGHHELDMLIYATGFDAMTGALLRVDIRGRGGRTLQDAWSAGPRTYLGLGVEGFPNLFTITGPGSPSVLTNMLVSIQQHVEWIADCIAHLREHGHTTIEPTLEAQDEWVDFVNSVASVTLFPTCNSWYLGANVPGKTRVFMPLPGFPTYAERCDQVVEDGYAGFILAG
jgi:cation diffusion facilitator CzcD-associated flavoprotein CzcO